MSAQTVHSVILQYANTDHVTAGACVEDWAHLQSVLQNLDLLKRVKVQDWII